uniref:Uncharacterized protein n=1 Tax=virus sp. ctiha2 TaxID=2827299 RepID=A0A8S5RHE6_9VIRU|nr:MAG TPA: hypothetical protein [virus sp. ctiha2]DAX13876.1 MAG TPA: hypothetical protein [Bacteriophage sp.]
MFFRVATNSIFLSRAFIYSLTSDCCSLLYSLFENNFCKKSINELINRPYSYKV